MRGARSILNWLDNNSTPRQMNGQEEQRTDHGPRRLGGQIVSVSPNQTGDPTPTDDTLEQAIGGFSNHRVHSAFHAPTGQVNETRLNEGPVIDEHDDSGTFITEQPYGAPQMDYTYHVSSETTFPYNRGPNLSKLTKVYYRLTSPFGPYNSNYAIHADDPSLSFIYAQHVPPPGFTRNFIALICAREAIHPTRAQIYLAQDDKNEGSLELPPVEPVHENVKLLLHKGGCGSNELNPLLVHVTVNRQMDRTEASQRRSVFVTGGEQATAITSQGCSALVVGLPFGRAAIRTYTGGTLETTYSAVVAGLAEMAQQANIVEETSEDEGRDTNTETS